jgi:hypothetical protein
MGYAVGLFMLVPSWTLQIAVKLTFYARKIHMTRLWVSKFPCHRTSFDSLFAANSSNIFHLCDLSLRYILLSLARSFARNL